MSELLGLAPTRYNKAYEVQYGCEERPEVPYQAQLEKDLAFTYYWSGNCLKDYFFFVANWHPLLGLFCSHPCHPWSKSERLGAFFVSCSLTLLPSALLVLHMDKLHADHRVKGATVFVLVTLPVTLVTTVLYYLSILDIFFEGSSCCLCRCCRWTVIRIKDFFFGVALLVCCLVVGTSIGLLQLDPNHDPQEIVRPFLMAQLQSFVTWFPLWFFMPCSGFLHSWCSEGSAAKQLADEAAREASVTWVQPGPVQPAKEEGPCLGGHCMGSKWNT